MSQKKSIFAESRDEQKRRQKREKNELHRRAVEESRQFQCQNSENPEGSFQTSGMCLEATEVHAIEKEVMLKPHEITIQIPPYAQGSRRLDLHDSHSVTSRFSMFPLFLICGTGTVTMLFLVFLVNYFE